MVSGSDCGEPSPVQASDEAWQSHQPSSEKDSCSEDSQVNTQAGRAAVNALATQGGRRHMARYLYPAVFDPNENGGYTVTFPDLPGCVTEGDTLDEALQMAA